MALSDLLCLSGGRVGCIIRSFKLDFGGDIDDMRVGNRGGVASLIGAVDDTLLLAECEAVLSGGDGNVIAASIFGNPGDSGSNGEA